MSENHHPPPSQKLINLHQNANYSPLLQLNQNIINNFTLPFQTNFKRQSYLQKKALYNKIQKGQIEHCCIDIVNRKNKSELIQSRKFNQTTKVSNIELLKKQIEYLEEDNLKWDKFPKKQSDFELIRTQNQKDNKKSLTLHLQALLKINQSHNSSLLKNFYNTFNNNFFVSPMPLKATTLQRRAKSYFSANKKKSLKSGLAIEPKTPILRENVFCRTIHSSSAQENTCRKYFLMNRARKHSIYTQNSSFVLQNRKRPLIDGAMQLQTL